MCSGGHCSQVQINHSIAASVCFQELLDLLAVFVEASLLFPYTVRFFFLLVRNFRESLDCSLNLVFSHLLSGCVFPPSNSECLTDLKQFRLLHGYF